MTLDENDYLTYQLYTASKAPRIKKARTRGWIITTLASLCMAYLFFENYNDLLAYYFLIAAGVSLIFHPLYSRWRYKRHYRKYIEDNYKNRIGQECALEITDDVIITKDKTGEGRINTTEVEEINEIKDFYFIKIKTGVSLIIPKLKTDTKDLAVIENGLKQLAEKKGIKWNVELNWKWR
jgi:hypothetical protein